MFDPRSGVPLTLAAAMASRTCLAIRLRWPRCRSSTRVQGSTIDTYARHPLDAVRGEGVRLWDARGRSTSICSPASRGEQRRPLPPARGGRAAEPGQLAAARQQPRAYGAGAQLAERLAKHSLGDGSKCFPLQLGRRGGRGCPQARAPRQERCDFVVVRDGFHGRTYGALSATPQESKQAPFAPLVPGFIVAEPTVEGITSAVTERTAAVLLEPIRGESGVWPVPHEVLLAAREACDRSGPP